MQTYNMKVNGGERQVASDDPDKPLLYVLRDMGLTAAKFGCGSGQCGACSVLVDGKSVRSCLMPISELGARAVTTPEGLGSPEKPSAIQAAFIEHQAAQCGYCTSGVLVTVTALLAAKPKPTEAEAKQALSGNICRCGSHARVIKAVMAASGQRG